MRKRFMLPDRQSVQLVVAGVLLAVVASALIWLQAAPAPTGPLAPMGASSGDGAAAAVTPGAAPVLYPNGVRVGTSAQPVLSRPLRDLKPVPHHGTRRVRENDNPSGRIQGHVDQSDPVVQRAFTPAGASSLASMPALSALWSGISFNDILYLDGGAGIPPDTDGEVGRNHYIQMVNSAYAIFNKSGTLLGGPYDINNMWFYAGVTNPCGLDNRGDPIVLYDQLADRWLISQFNFGEDANGHRQGPYYECIAVTETADPLGQWWLYSFQMNSTDFPDYPHLGVWPDGYYAEFNMFPGGGGNTGTEPVVFQRSAMLNGQSANFQFFPPGPQGLPLMLPADLDGTTPPPAGTPNFFVQLGTTLNVWRYHVNWTTPSLSSFTQSATLPAAGFTELCPGVRDCIPQPGTTQKLDGIGDRPIFRVAYRNFGDHEALLATHAVSVSPGYAGVRWYEVRNPSSSPSIAQQGTYAPADGNHRWLPSLAMDHSGDMAVGYSISGSSKYPSIRYAGRLYSDPAGTLGQGEAEILAGSGSQSSSGQDIARWGDYADMTVDPVDDCTFYFTTEFNSSFDWAWETRIAAFKFPSCGPPPPTATPRPATATATATRRPATATATATLRPATATATRRPATATATSTPRPATATATNTPRPATATPTATRRPATATVTATWRPVTATATATRRPATATATATLRPATATATATRRPATATATATLRPATATPTRTPGGATATPTRTPIPTGWTAAASYPIPILDQAMAATGTALYSFSGVSNGALTTNAYKYDQATNLWSPIAPLPAAREAASAVSDGTYIYILGGVDSTGTAQSTVFRYNPALNTYTTLASYTTATWAQAAVYSSGKIYRIAGLNSAGTAQPSVEIYTISTNAWTLAAYYPDAEGFLQATAYNGYIYTAGGGNGTTLKTYRYTPSSNVWDDTGIADLPVNRWGAASAMYNGRWILAGGAVNGFIDNSVIAWNPVSNTWTTLAPMLQPRYRLAGAATTMVFYAVGGRSDSTFTGTQNTQRYGGP